MRSGGYRQENPPASLARAVRDMLKRYSGKFVRGKGRAVGVGGNYPAIELDSRKRLLFLGGRRGRIP